MFANELVPPYKLKRYKDADVQEFLSQKLFFFFFWKSKQVDYLQPPETWIPTDSAFYVMAYM